MAPLDDPFRTMDTFLLLLAPPDSATQRPLVIVDFHAEATSEKLALGWSLAGRVAAVVGTHTHVPTADERVLPGGTAYITDLGMTGPYDSVLGRDKTPVIKALVTGMHYPYVVATEDVRLSGVIVDVDEDTGRARSIERLTGLSVGPARD